MVSPGPQQGEGFLPSPHQPNMCQCSPPVLWGWRNAPARAGQMLGPGSKQHQRQLLCSFLPGLFACVGCVPRRTRRRESGRVSSPVPACAATLLLQRLQDQEGVRAQVYRELESVLCEDDSRLPCGLVNRLLAEVSQDLTAAQDVTDNVRLAASNVLVALARTHFSLVMAELQGHLKAAGEMTKELVLITLSKLFSTYAPQCIPFVWLTLASLRSVVDQVRSGQMLRIACAVVKQWSDGIKVHLSSGKQCPWRAVEKERIYENLHQLFFSVVRHWQDSKEEEDKQAVLGAVASMMAVLLQEELHIWKQFLWLMHPCQEIQDTCRVAKSLTTFLEVLEGVQCVIPRDKFLAITSAVFYQLSDDTKQHSEADSAELTHCILLQARMCPEETILFLQSQLENEWEPGCVAALGLLGALARSDEPVVTEKLPLAAEAVQRLCSDLRLRVRRAILYFIKDLLSADTRSCSAWDVVGHIFREFSRATGRRAAGDLSAQEAQEEGALQQLCMDILGSLDVSVRGMSKLLWPRLLLFVVPAQYTGMLIPVSRCVQALAEREELTRREIEELDPHFLSSMFRGPWLTPQTLLVRLLVVAGSPVAGSELQAAALVLMQKLHSRIHRALGAMWDAEIPLLLQCVQGKEESFPDSAAWERRLLKLLRASVETVEDEAWTKGLSCELSRYLSSSPSSSGEKSFLYKALGTVLGACKGVLHIQEKLLQHLQEANAEEPSEAQGMISLLSHAAESNFRAVLDTLTMFSSRLCKGRNSRISRHKKMELDSTRAHATRSALVLAHGSLALCASKEELLAHVEGDIVGNILLLYSCSCQDLQNKLALVQSITNFSSAFHAVGDCFNLSLKGKLLEILMDLLKRYHSGIPVSPVPLKVVLALEELSKLKPSGEAKDMCEMLALCCRSIVTYPSAKMMLKIRKSQQAARYLQLLHASLKALGRMMAALLETEPTRDFFQNIIHVLRRPMTSGNVWERRRALQVCSQLLAVCEELRREDACQHFGSLVGFLAPLTCDPMPTSRQLAVTCLSSLLRIQAKVTNRVVEMGDPGSLCEGLHACSTVGQLRASCKIARMVCRNFPMERTIDFLMAIKETFRKAKGMRVRAAGQWMITFLQMYRKDICRDVPLILYVLRSCTSSTQQSMFMPFVCQAVVILTRCHTEVAIDNFSRLLGPTDSDTWRRIREFCLKRWRR
ncbi:maestro heat-like repeat-containing protein family member 2B [Tympanuchus pallidicinctus]|uniref:maestro heat-like repeat-containing protein family member 2B n=1 Tax=Tympanuchus pallidicinctus TaxID=109042 RepID=UPI002286D481|nr:maestro heat-like repeat-containing protein family member 2B [Tympanuchus pallidicinctus]